MKIFLIFLMVYLGFNQQLMAQYDLPYRDFKEEDTLKKILVIAPFSNFWIPKYFIEPGDTIRLKIKSTKKKYRGAVHHYSNSQMTLFCEREYDYLTFNYDDIEWIKVPRMQTNLKLGVSYFALMIGIAGIGYGILETAQKLINNVPLSFNVLVAPAIGIANASFYRYLERDIKYQIDKENYTLITHTIDKSIYRRKIPGVDKPKYKRLPKFKNG